MVRRRELAALPLALLVPRAAQAASVDLLLVLCMDASGSIDQGEFELQRRGYAEVIGDPRIVEAMTDGEHRATAIAVVEWGSPMGAATVVPWMVVRDRASAEALAKALIDAPRSHQTYNAIGDAIEHSIRLITSAPHQATRRVIDVSGDGPDMRGRRPAHEARDAAVAAAITVNALVIVDESRTGPRGQGLVGHYERDVIGGPGAFVMVADGRRAFAQSIRAKLLREVAGLDGPRVVVTTAPSPLTPLPQGERGT
ncbi:MAG: DUF1194 domain-containing protein [Reyranellaceae bacterium]